MTSTEHVYFILTKRPESPGHLKAGSICYAPESKYKRRVHSSKVNVTPLDSYANLDYAIDLDCMTELSAEHAELLLALPDDKERLQWFQDKSALQTAVGLTEGDAIIVLEGEDEMKGIIRYIGTLSGPKYKRPLAGRFFGIELQGADKGKGTCNGKHQYKDYFSCEKKCAVFVPFSKVRPLVPISLTPTAPEPPPQQQTEALLPGDRVTYFIEDKFGHGMVVDVLKEDGERFVQISTDTDENGKMGGEVKMPLHCVVKGEVSAAEPEKMDIDTPPTKSKAYDPRMLLSVNSLVEVNLALGRSYGTIRWIGNLHDIEHPMAGLELDEDVGVSDGTFKGERYFHCPPKRGLFLKLSSCHPDSRFQSLSANHSEKMPKLEDTEVAMGHSTGRPETVPPISTEQVSRILTGRMKGIQGHCNSCYMDAALFSLFSCSSVLDSMLYKSTEPQDAPIQRTLLCDIVNPLRSKGFVDGRYVMKLRQQLEKHGYSHSFTTEEKDPEEFLIVIMHHILSLDPLLKLSAGGKVQESYCYQIFLDQNHSLVLPTVQQLLEHSFHSGRLRLAEVPSCLILQMPRFGKKFKMFDKIIPSLELDVTDLLSDGPQQCIICGNMAAEQCNDCFKDPVFSCTGFKVFCRMCSTQVHSHQQRRSHRPAALVVPKEYVGHHSPHTLTRDKLELFAVLCIETSHYVSFIKYGPSPEDWLFFDSMADREGGTDGFNIPEVRVCPEVGTYLEMSPAELASQAPRDMKGVAKRLFCDAYMYLYQSTSMCLYR
ncbi:ubiquitin carboxyl-terminal hydrolase CYLD [Solea solea]|uniref:ubiquitin carboxyl-terminal hydrolase CYLD n=1 Tax=Solea solea TaxID=90069 RepID=UPI002729DA19|nr:ubiquitin carboxyl-terminal hydrolase CYLD [Solea solea]